MAIKPSNPKQTSRRVASLAGKQLRDQHSTPREKSVAASDLAQARRHKKK